MHTAELLQAIWRTHRNLLILVGALLFFNLALYLVLQQFVVPRVEQREQDFIGRQAEARQLVRRSGGYADTPEQHYVKTMRDIAEFRRIVPQHYDFTGLIDELMVLAYRADLNIDQISYDQENLEKLDLLQYELAFTVTGPYAQIKQFIHALEQSPRLMGIRQIALNSKVDDGSTRVTLRLMLETVFIAEAGKP